MVAIEQRECNNNDTAADPVCMVFLKSARKCCISDQDQKTIEVKKKPTPSGIKTKSLEAVWSAATPCSSRITSSLLVLPDAFVTVVTTELLLLSKHNVLFHTVPAA